MSEFQSPDRLDELLYESSSDAIADQGFTERVVAALPKRGAHPLTRLKPALVLGFAGLGGALAALMSPEGVSLVQGFVDLARLRGPTQAATMAMATALALLVCAVVLATDTD